MSEFDGGEGGGFEDFGGEATDWGGESDGLGGESGYEGGQEQAATWDDFWDLVAQRDAEEAAANVPGVRQGEVTGRFFWPDGSPREEPGPGSSDELWTQHLLGQVAAQEQAADQVSAFDYEDVPATTFMPGLDQLNDAARHEAGLKVAAEQYEAGLRDHVQTVAKGMGVRDAQAVEEVAREVESARRGLFERWLSEGASVPQALQALAALDVDGGGSGRAEAARVRCGDRAYQARPLEARLRESARGRADVWEGRAEFGAALPGTGADARPGRGAGGADSGAARAVPGDASAPERDRVPVTPKAKPPAAEVTVAGPLDNAEKLRKFRGALTASEFAAEHGPPPERWKQRSRVLRITEEDGLGGPGRISEIALDVTYPATLIIETTVASRERPWETEQVHASMGLHSVREISFELVDVDPEA